MSMKYNRLAVFVETTDKKFYQVGLDKKEMDMIADFIRQMHNGTIEVRDETYDTLSFEKKKNNNK